MPESIHDVISPFAFRCFQIFGYAVFVAAWGVIFYSAGVIAKSVVAGLPSSLEVARRDPVKVIGFARSEAVMQ